MRNILKVLMTFCLTIGSCSLLPAQNSYLVTTKATQKNSGSNADSPEQEFINAYFRNYKLCEWIPGMRFMVIPERRDMIIPTFKDGSTHKEVSSGDLKYRIFEYLGYEITERGYIRFDFDSEGKYYYHEVKNTTLDEYCVKPKAGIPTLAFLDDVDAAKNLLEGSTLYMRTTKVRVDDPNSTSGYQETSIKMNEKVKVTAVGVGTRSFPVKIVFEDSKGNSYYLPVAISKTNCGMVDDDFIMDNKNKFFPNAFSFSDANAKVSESLMDKYGNRNIYLKKKTTCYASGGEEVKMPRYTHFKIKNIISDANSPFHTLELTSEEGTVYAIKVTFGTTSTANTILQTDNYFNDVFGIGNLKERYPDINAEMWQFISRGEIRTGMSKDECRLSLGNPIRIHRVGADETWFYQRKTLDFTGKKLVRIY